LVAALGVLILNIVLPTCWNVAVGRGIDVENTFRMTGLYHTRRMFMFEQLDDSWGPMVKAFDYVQHDGRQKLYKTLFFEREVKFQYPPSSLLVFYPIRAAGLYDTDGGLPGGVLKPFLAAVSWVMVIVTVGVGIRIFFLTSRRTSNDTNSGAGSKAVIAAALVVMGLTFYPLAKGYSLGQIQVWVTALFAVAAWSWLTGRQAAAGVAIGLMCLVKPHYALLLFWGLLRRRWAFSVAMAVTAGVGVLASIAAFGWANHLDYLEVVRFMSRHGEVFYANQSINGLLNRWLSGSGEHFDPHAFAPYRVGVYVATVASSAVLLLGALIVPMLRRHVPGGLTDLLLMTITVTVASPIAWEHHFAILLVAFCALAGMWLARPAQPRAMGLMLLASYLLVSNYSRLVKDLYSHGSAVAHAMVSHLLIGVLLLLVTVYWSILRKPASPTLAASTGRDPHGD